jgi:hypothetical protein
MLYTIDYEEVSQPEFTRKLQEVAKGNSILDEYDDGDFFFITEYEDGAELAVSHNSKELTTASSLTQ